MSPGPHRWAPRAGLCAAAALAVLVCGMPAALGGGAGGSEGGPLQVGDRQIRILLEADPPVLRGGEEWISVGVRAVDDATGGAVEGVLYRITFSDPGGAEIVSFEAYAPGASLEARMVPSQETSFSGDPAGGGAWLASPDSPLQVSSPLFLGGGIYGAEVVVLSVGSEPVPGGAAFEVPLTMGQFVPFAAEIGGESHNLTFATYFDRVEGFESGGGSVRAHMPFRWDAEYIGSLPFVHAEYYIPKSVAEFNGREILLAVNGIPYFGTIDRSGPDEIVVHYLLSQSKLLGMIGDVPEGQGDVMIFEMAAGMERDVQGEDAALEDGDRAVVLSSQEDWKFHLTLSPAGGISPGVPVTLDLEFRDPVTNTVIPQVTYDLDVLLDGAAAGSWAGREAPGGTDSVTVTFGGEGAAIAAISNVNGYGTEGQFSFRVSEPGPLAGGHAVSVGEGTSLPGCEADGSCYMPGMIAIGPGESVLWENEDSAAHTVTAGSPEGGPSGAFESGIIPAGGTYAFEFAEEGRFGYYCSLHPWMTGAVTVGAGGDGAVPGWVRQSAGWWADGRVGDAEFAAAIGFLVGRGVIDVPAVPGGGAGAGGIPDWVRSTAGWWAEGSIDDSEFLRGIGWLVANGIIPA